MLFIIYALLSAAFGLCFFIIPLWAYRRGMKDMKALMEGKTPEPIRSPVQAVMEHREKVVESKETKKANSALTQGMLNLMSYDGTPQKEVRND